MAEATYVVNGMSCEHCVRSVTEEVSEISGVRDVDVDLASGRLRINSETELDSQDVRNAVAEAGYELSA